MTCFPLERRGQDRTARLGRLNLVIREPSMATGFLRPFVGAPAVRGAEIRGGLTNSANTGNGRSCLQSLSRASFGTTFQTKSVCHLQGAGGKGIRSLRR